MKKQMLVILAAIVSLYMSANSVAQPVTAGPATQTAVVRPSTAVTVEEACANAEWERTKLSRMTHWVKPTKDRFGDPMYIAYGPLPYADSPMYNGPRYVASFERDFSYQPDAVSRGIYRGTYSHGGLSARTDTTLGVGATHSYMQAGMMIGPGSMAPTVSRVTSNNH